MLDVDIVKDHAVLREGLTVWLEGGSEGIGPRLLRAVPARTRQSYAKQRPN